MKNKILGILMIVLGVLIIIGFVFFVGGKTALDALLVVLSIFSFIGITAGLIAGGIIKLSK